MRQVLIKNATTILLQNATKVYYKMREVVYYKMRVLLQIATIITKYVNFITKCDSYYKILHLSQYVSVQLLINIHNLTCSLIRTTYYSMNGRKII